MSLGLNLSKEIGTHFTQESMLKSSCALAVKMHLPLILHINDAESLLRTIEILQSENYITNEPEDALQQDKKNGEAHETLRILLHDPMTCCEGKIEHFQAAIQAGFTFMLTVKGLVDSTTTMEALNPIEAQECIRLIPIDKLVLCTDSPWKTPQNLPDVNLRTLRNEPSNIASIASAVATVRNIELLGLAAAVRSNTMKIFELAATHSDTLDSATATADALSEEVQAMKLSDEKPDGSASSECKSDAMKESGGEGNNNKITAVSAPKATATTSKKPTPAPTPVVTADASYSP